MLPYLDIASVINLTFVFHSQALCCETLQMLPPSAALSVLGELSPGGSLMKNTQQVPLKDTVSVEVQRDLRNIYIAQFELLRHFWTCFPATSAQLEEKVIK